MEAEEAEAVKLHLFSSKHCFEWLKWNSHADVDLIGVANGITRSGKKFLTTLQNMSITWMKLG